MIKYLTRVPFLGLILVFVISISGCQRLSGEHSANFKGWKRVPIEYARGFAIFHNGKFTRVVVYNPWGKGKPLASFVLVKGRPKKGQIHVPLNKVGVFSATQLDAMKQLGLLDKVIGVSDIRYLNNKEIKKRYSEHKVEELAAGGNYFVEKILETAPHALFYSPYNSGQQLPSALASIPAIPFMDYMEPSPLGRAEWIKFTAVFFGKEKMADSIFNEIKTKYLKLKKLTKNIKNRPTVFSGKYYSGQWYVPGGNSYIAQIFHDAGANYVWKDIPKQGSFPLDFETVFKTAHNADFWRIIGTFGAIPSYAELAKENELFTQFKAFKEHHVIYCNPGQTAYFETSPLQPQIILADFIKAFHPELLPHYKPRYYKILP